MGENNISKERVAVFICVPITVLSVIVSAVLLYGSGRNKKQDIQEEGSGYGLPSLFEESTDVLSSAKNSLEYQSLGDGSCLVMGIGTCIESEVVM